MTNRDKPILNLVEAYDYLRVDFLDSLLHLGRAEQSNEGLTNELVPRHTPEAKLVSGDHVLISQTHTLIEHGLIDFSNGRLSLLDLTSKRFPASILPFRDGNKVLL
jgi:hypothetical protein